MATLRWMPLPALAVALTAGFAAACAQDSTRQEQPAVYWPEGSGSPQLRAAVDQASTSAALATTTAAPWYDWTGVPVLANETAMRIAQGDRTMPGGAAMTAPPQMQPPHRAKMQPGHKARVQLKHRTHVARPPGGPGLPATPPMMRLGADTWVTDQDQGLVERVRAALQANALTSTASRDVRLAADDGVVTVKGLTGDRLTHDNVLEVVRTVAGEGMVKDALYVRRGPRR